MSSLSKKLITILLALSVSLSPLSQPASVRAAAFEHHFPRLANYFLKWQISADEAAELSRWQVVILDIDSVRSSLESLKLIRRLNPRVILLAYITAQEIRIDADHLDHQSIRYQLAKQISENWHLKDARGQKTNWWPGTYLLNISNVAQPNYDGKKFNELLPEFVADQILYADDSTGDLEAKFYWDGVFYDNVWGGVSWMNLPFDFNEDGLAESPTDQNWLWQEGMRKLLDRTRELIGPNKLIVTNDGLAYYQMINGSLFETFPVRGWEETINNYYLVQKQALPPGLGVINSNTENTGLKDFRQVRFGLASSFLSNGYFSYDYGDKDHGQLWWFDEYSAFLGKPKNEPRNLLAAGSAGVGQAAVEFKPGFWRRDFEQGIIFLNSTDSGASADLGGEYEKLRGQQDQSVNDGLIVDSVTVPAQDGLILLRPLDRLSGAVFGNGTFVRIFDRQGLVKRNGFFSYVNRFRGGSNIYEGAFSPDNVVQTVVAKDGRLDFYDASGVLLREIAPYGARYKGPVNFTVADLDKDGHKEIITVPGLGGGPHARIFNRDGVLINPGFFPFDKNFRGGARVAAGDFLGNGSIQLAFAPGPGGVARVKVFDLKFNRLVQFPVYEQGFRGGVSLAAGDLTGDGVAEIITGQESGGVQVKVFGVDGKLRYTPFDAFKTNKSQGVKVIAADLDGDRAIEILATSSKTFTLSSIREDGRN